MEPGPNGIEHAPTGGPCRFCGAELVDTFVDLGMSPLCETFLTRDELLAPETFYPLHVFVCRACFLVQLQEFVAPDDIFREYAYFSSYSEAWLAHCRAYVDQMASSLDLGPDSLVVELASNDGYLLQYFVQKGIPVLGVEPALNVARVAEERGVPTHTEFFGREEAARLASRGVRADLVLGNNVLAQVPDINDFVGGIPAILAPGGTVTFEFPHLQRLVEQRQFDTIYHEHFSYFSLVTIERIFAAHGLRVFDVEELWTHGGSLRIHACHADDERGATERLDALRDRELGLGMETVAYYRDFGRRVEELRRSILRFFVEARERGERVVGYGAPGKGNTLLNYCGIRSDLLEFTVDRNPYKHGRFLPGTHIPVLAPEVLHDEKADYVFILPWNLRDEIAAQLAPLRERGTRLVVPIPDIEIF
ncbi:MAG: methyltransferase domain-containing protein [Deltaproteobacteria bacterium]|nr:MAG: methyltransferase domain-containing protein [Deltaproteobacteria bacterium]